MGASRKLQCEIDRVLKRVQEGVDDFDSIWNKVHDAANANQREKYEAELKKEIKKLQRYRDQIKTWIQSSEIRDKKVNASYEQALVDARKQIEREMERFKVCEKEAKTKAFSKEGLEQQPKTDPKEKAKAETRDWLNNVVGDLESQIDNFEAEMETVSTRKGKTKPTHLLHLEASVTRHKAHIMKLEQLLRKLDNDELSPEEINDIKDLIEDYVERNQDDFDEFNDVNELYISLPLDNNEAKPEDFLMNGSSAVAKGAVVPTILQADSVQESQKESTFQGSTAAISSPADHGVFEALVEANSVIDSSDNDLVLLSSAGNASSHSLAYETASLNLPGSGSDRRFMDGSACTTSVNNSCAQIYNDNIVSLSDVPSPPSEMVIRRELGQEAAVGIATQNSNVSVSIGSSSGVSNAGAFVVQSSSSHGDRSAVLSDGDRMLLQNVPKCSGNVSTEANNNTLGVDSAGRASTVSAASAGQWKPPTDMTTFKTTDQLDGVCRRPEIAPDHVEKFKQQYQQIQLQGHSNYLNEFHMLGSNPKLLTGQQHIAVLQQFGQSSHSEVGSGSQLLQRPNYINQQLCQPDHINQQLSQPPHIKNEHGPVNVEDPYLRSSWTVNSTLKSTKSNGDDSMQPCGAPKPTSAEISLFSRNPSMLSNQSLQYNQSFSTLGVGDHRNSGEKVSLQDPTNYNLQMLEAAYSKLPQPRDSERATKYIPARPAVTPSSYPQTPLLFVGNPTFWESNHELDTLFFAFYYQQNTYQQYLAAKELRKRAWRYHKKYHTWFQRHEEPKITTDDYEQGSYVYFDFRIDDHPPQGWCQRIKNDFRFQYDFLEDELV